MSLFKLGYELLCENDVDRFLLLFDKPIDKVLNKDIMLYHGSCYDIKSNVLTPMGANVGATKYSTPRWSTFFWDNLDLAKKWALCWAIGKKGSGIITLYKGEQDRILIFLEDGSKPSEEEMFNLVKDKVGYVYTVRVPASKVEIGSSTTINEYTISEPVKIHKKEKIKITKELFLKYFEIISQKEAEQIYSNMKHEMKKATKVRGPILNTILNGERDLYTYHIRREVRNGNVKTGDDLSYLKNIINASVKNKDFFK